MTGALRWASILGLGLIATANGVAAVKTYGAISTDTSLVITIHVHDYAELDRKTLTEARAVATEIFGKVGVETRWIEGSDEPRPNSVEDKLSDLTHLRLNILSPALSDRFRLPSEVMGLAPGSGRDRYIVYVFFNRILGFNGTQSMLDGMYLRTSRTLGYAVAHEIGHILLNTEGHSESGIMRGHWTHRDLQAIATGRLSFTPEQAEVIRAEVARRGRRLLGTSFLKIVRTLNEILNPNPDAQGIFGTSDLSARLFYKAGTSVHC